MVEAEFLEREQERLLVRGKSQLQWRPQEVGDVRNSGHLWRASSVKWCWPVPNETSSVHFTWQTWGRAVQTHRTKIMTESKMLDNELFTLQDLGFALI